jgi:alpha-L-rhamnosidase
MTCGSEATVVRDVIVENCKAIGVNNIAVLKLRPDTPQHYEDIHFRNLTLDAPTGRSTIIQVQPWSQYVDLKGETPPKSIVRNVSLEGFKGRFVAFGTIKPNPGQTEISDILLKDFDVGLTREKLDVAGVANLRMQNVVVNGKAYSA